MAEVVYEMLMKIGLAGSAAEGLLAISNHLRTIDSLAERIGFRIGGWKAGLIAFGSILGGATILGSMYKIINATRDYNDELIKLQSTGGKMADWVQSGEMTNRAFDISKRVPMSLDKSLQIPGYTYSLLRGNKEEIMGSWEKLQKYAYTMRFFNHFQGDMGKNIQETIRAGDITGRITDPATGQIDMEKLYHWLDMSFKMQTATHNAINPHELLNFAKQGGVALRGLNDEGMYHMGTLIQSLGGYRTGTAYLSEWQQLAAGVMRSRTGAGLEKMGFLHKGEWKSDRGGGVEITENASKRLVDLIAQDPMKFAHDIKEKLAKLGIANPVDQIRMIMRMTGRQTTQRLVAEMVANYAQMMSEGTLMGQGYNVDQAFKLTQDKSIDANLNNMHDAWKNLMIALGGNEGEIFIKWLKAITSVINSVTDYVKTMDPETLKILWGGGLGAGLGLLGGGTLALLMGALGPTGWLVLGLSAMAGTLAVLHSKNIDWKKDPIGSVGEGVRELPIMQRMKKWFEDLQEKALRPLKGFFDFVDNSSASLYEMAKRWSTIDPFAPIKNAIQSFLSWINSVPDRLNNWFKNHVPSSGNPDEANPFKIPGAFHPGSHKQILQPITLNVNLDGRTLGQAVSDAMEDLYTHAPQAPAFNGTQAFANPDTNYA